MLKIRKFSLVVTTRCNLKCRLCDEFIPANKPFADMSPAEAEQILSALFEVADHVDLLHLSGGGEPFINPELAELVELCFRYADQFDRLMLFTNSTIIPGNDLLDTLERHKEKIVVHASNYGLRSETSAKVYEMLKQRDIPLREVKYYGEKQEYGGWVDFGSWEQQDKSESELSERFANCGITKNMHGNWRTRDGKSHWCQRSQRGMELGIIPDCPEYYVDLLDTTTTSEQKCEKFRRIMNASYLSACQYCSGDHGTDDPSKRFPAGQQF